MRSSSAARALAVAVAVAAVRCHGGLPVVDAIVGLEADAAADDLLETDSKPGAGPADCGAGAENCAEDAGDSGTAAADAVEAIADDISLDGQDLDLLGETQAEVVDAMPETAPGDGFTEIAEVAEIGQADVGPVACPIGATATASNATLVPMPVTVKLQAMSGGSLCVCEWASATPSVCVVSADGIAKKVGDGLCKAQCAVGGIVTASLELKASAQWVIYYVGGVCEKAAWAETIPCGAKLWRWRTSDQAWDVDFSQLPEARGASPVVFARGHDIWVGGGGSYGLGWDPFTQAGAWGKDSVAPKCKEALSKDLGGTAEEYTCRAIRRLNLDTGEWDSPFEWKHPRSQTLYTDTGGLVWLSNGAALKGSGFPLPWAGEVIDPDGQVTYNMAIPPTATYWPQGAPSALWGDAIVQGSYSTLALLDAKTLSVFKPFPDPDWPCKWNSVYSMVTFPGTQTLMIFGSGKKAPCPAVQYINPNQPLLEWIQPLLYTPGSGWTVGDHLPEATGRLVAAGDKLYFASNGGIMRLDSPTGKWQFLSPTPKQPIYRTGYGAVAVWQ